MKEISLELPDEYRWVLLCVCILAVESILVQYATVVPARLKHFNVEYVSQFQQEHQANFGADTLPTQGGFPDTGNGWYADKLEYKQWYEFNNAMRVQQNFVEGLPMLIVFLLVGGV